jgi:hypothetical protein
VGDSVVPVIVLILEPSFVEGSSIHRQIHVPKASCARSGQSRFDCEPWPIQQHSAATHHGSYQPASFRIRGPTGRVAHLPLNLPRPQWSQSIVAMGRSDLRKIYYTCYLCGHRVRVLTGQQALGKSVGTCGDTLVMITTAPNPQGSCP